MTDLQPIFEFSYELTFREYYKGVSKRRYLFKWIMVFVWGSYCLIADMFESNSLGVVALLMLLIWVVPGGPFFLLFSHFLKIPVMQFHVEIDTEVIRFEILQGEHRRQTQSVKLREISETGAVRESKDFFLIQAAYRYCPPRILLPIPKRAFPEEELERFREFCKKTVGARYSDFVSCAVMNLKFVTSFAGHLK